MDLKTKKARINPPKEKGGQFKIPSNREKSSKSGDTPSKQKSAQVSAKQPGGEKDLTVPTKARQPEKSRVVLMDVDPHWLHAYWEFTQSDKTKILEQSDKPSHPQKKILRVYDVSYICFDGNNAHNYFDIEIDNDRGNWYINLWSPRKSFCAEIGMRFSQGDFYPLARSNAIDIPRPYQSPFGEEQWMKVSGNHEDVSLLPAKAQTEKIESKETFPPSEKELPEPDLKKTHTPLSKKKVLSKSTPPSAKKEPSQETTIIQNVTSLPKSHKGKIPSGKELMKNEIKNYHEKVQFIGRHQKERTQITPAINTHPESGTPLEEDLTQRLCTERHTNYGSDIRWEEEVKKPDGRDRVKIVTPEMIKKIHFPE